MDKQRQATAILIGVMVVSIALICGLIWVEALKH